MADMSGPNPQVEMREHLMGFVISRALQVAAELGVADALADGPKDRTTLAKEVGAHPDTLYRLLRALAGFGVFEELADGRLSNTVKSECLRSGVPGSLRGLARMYAGESLWQAWVGLEHSVKSGESSFTHVHGMPVFDYLAAHPEAGRRFDEGMVASSRLMNEALIEAYEWRRFRTLVDVAGGVGSTLGAILAANPGMQGILFDLPHVIERGREHLAQLGVADRCRTESGSFFDAVPAGADAYFMKHIIHDWDDEDCLTILRNCREAMSDDATLVVCEKVVPHGNAPSYAKTMDLVMLALTDGGRERTEAQFRDLFARASLRLTRIIPTDVGNALLEVRR
jgi:hypothetical protein